MFLDGLFFCLLFLGNFELYVSVLYHFRGSFKRDSYFSYYVKLIQVLKEQHERDHYYLLNCSREVFGVGGIQN